MDKILFGSYYINGKAAPPGSSWGNPDTGSSAILLTIGNTVAGKEIEWAKVSPTKYVATRTGILGISWQRLSALGLVKGVPVEIDGKHFVCRLPEVSPTKDFPSEWDYIVTLLGNLDKHLHWKGIGFWTQSFDDGLFSLTQGGSASKAMRFRPKTDIVCNVGFRPILEATDEEVSSIEVGETVTVYAGGKVIAGTCLSQTDYDVAIASHSVQKSVSGVFVVKNKDEVIIDREKISWIQKGAVVTGVK